MRALLVYGVFKSNFYYIFPSEELHLFSSKLSGCCIIDYLKSIFFKRRSDLSVFYTIKIYFCDSHHFLKDFSIKLVRKRKPKQSGIFYCSTNYYWFIYKFHCAVFKYATIKLLNFKRHSKTGHIVRNVV